MEWADKEWKRVTAPFVLRCYTYASFISTLCTAPMITAYETISGAQSTLLTWLIWLSTCVRARAWELEVNIPAHQLCRTTKSLLGSFTSLNFHINFPGQLTTLSYLSWVCESDTTSAAGQASAQRLHCICRFAQIRRSDFHPSLICTH